MTDKLLGEGKVPSRIPPKPHFPPTREAFTRRSTRPPDLGILENILGANDKPETSYNAGKNIWWFFMNGVHLGVKKSEADMQFVIDGKNIFIPKDASVARVNFLPFLKSSSSKTLGPELLEKIKMGQAGLTQGIERIVHSNSVPKTDWPAYEKVGNPEYVTGETNWDMANIAQRLGFRIHDEDMAKKKEIIARDGKFRVIGKITDIQSSLRSQQSSLAKLKRRVDRTQK